MQFGPDPVRVAVDAALAALDREGTIEERRVLDLKEEAGRRRPDGTLRESQPRNEVAAAHLASGVACMANTRGGGALLVGISDDSELIGTTLETDWLRARLYQLLDRKVTVEAHEVTIRHRRLVVLIVPEAVESVPYRGKLKWRVGDACVEIDPSSWHVRRAELLMSDWSAQPSSLTADLVRAAAVDQVRDFMRESVDSASNDLAEAKTPDLLRRLNAVNGDGVLSNAAALLLVGREQPCLDYLRRDAPGGDSQQRVRRSDRSLVEQLAEVFSVAAAYNPTRHVTAGLVAGQVRPLPERALREAVVNGVAHREWGVADPTTIEHVGHTLRVVSPGGFVEGVTSSNIINHPSKSRNAAMTELLARIKVAEREGIGVDRMVKEMLRFGHRLPDISESGAGVLTTLVGGQIDLGWMAWLAEIGPARITDDLQLVMGVNLLMEQGWIDDRELGRYLQVGEGVESHHALWQLNDLRLSGEPLLSAVVGVPPGRPPAYAASPQARHELDRWDFFVGAQRQHPTRDAVARSYVRSRGRISSTELASLVGARTANVQRVLRDMEDDGLVEPSRPNRRGAGFFYRHVARGESNEAW